MTLKGGTSSACAACKYQRRRCTSECPLAPYFPADQPKMFQNAHKLFGVRKILKILEHLDPGQQIEAMKSIKYQANARDKNPVYGCTWEIQRLTWDLQVHHEELQAVNAQLAFFRQQQQIEISSTPNDSMSQLQLGMAPPSNALTIFPQDGSQNYNGMAALPMGAHSSFSNSGNATYNTGFVESKDNNNNVANPLWISQPYSNSNNNNNNNNNNTTVAQSQMIASLPLAVQQESAQDYDEIHPFFDTIDDRQSYIESKEGDESSSDSLKDTTQSVEHVAENELKNAAACFSLTSVN